LPFCRSDRTSARLYARTRASERHSLRADGMGTRFTRTSSRDNDDGITARLMHARVIDASANYAAKNLRSECSEIDDEHESFRPSLPSPLNDNVIIIDRHRSKFDVV